MLIKLNLPKHFVNALQIIYSKKTGKAAVEAYLESPVSIPVPPYHDNFIDLCRDMDGISDQENPTGLAKTLADQYAPEYSACVVHAAQLVRAFDAEKELQS